MKFTRIAAVALGLVAFAAAPSFAGGGCSSQGASLVDGPATAPGAGS